MSSKIIITEVTDEKELAEARSRREKFDRNAAWFQKHSREIYQKYRGKCVLIANRQLFVTDTPEEAWDLAEKIEPADDGKFVQYIPKQKVIRVYDNWR